jgi:hypothetical protein
MAINFPDTPTDGQVFTSGSQSWTYFSTPGVWKVTSGAIGFTGSRGFTGSTGYTGSGGANGINAGAEANGVIWETYNQVDVNYTLTSNKNGMSVGPVIVANGASVTIPDGQRWVII